MSWIPTVACLVIPLLLILIARRAVIQQRERKVLREQHPNEQWLWRRDWAARTSVDQSHANSGLLWLVAAVWNLISLPLFFGVFGTGVLYLALDKLAGRSTVTANRTQLASRRTFFGTKVLPSNDVVAIQPRIGNTTSKVALFDRRTAARQPRRDHRQAPAHAPRCGACGHADSASARQVVPRWGRVLRFAELTFVRFRKERQLDRCSRSVLLRRCALLTRRLLLPIAAPWT